MKVYNRYLFALVVLFSIQMGVMIYFGFQKQNFHMDEYFSYYSTSVDNFYIGLQDYEWNPGDIAIDRCRVDSDRRFDYKNVYEMEAKDVHPPLYYYCLHTICSLFPETFSKWTGLGLNIFFFALSFIILGKITWLLSDKNYPLVLAVNLFYGLNPAVLSAVMFIRMYMLLTLLILLFVYIHLRIIQTGYRIGVKDGAAIVLVSMAGFLTHYYFIIFAGIFSALITICAWLETRKIKPGILNFGCFLTGIGAAVLYYPSCIEHIFFGYRGTGAQEAFLDIGNTLYRFRYFLHLTSRFAFADRLKEIAVAVIILFVSAVFVMGSRRKKRMTATGTGSWTGAWIALILAAGGYYVLIAKTALTNEDEMVRYMVPIYPLLFLFMIMGVVVAFRILTDNKKTEKIVWAALLFGGLALNLYGMKEEGVLFLYPGTEERIRFAGEHRDSDIMLVRGNEGWTWVIAEDLSKYSEFYCVPGSEINELDDKKIKESDEIVVYMDSTNPQTEQTALDFILQYNNTVSQYEKIFEIDFYNIYLFQ